MNACHLEFVLWNIRRIYSMYFKALEIKLMRLHKNVPFKKCYMRRVL